MPSTNFRKCVFHLTFALFAINQNSTSVAIVAAIHFFSYLCIPARKWRIAVARRTEMKEEKKIVTRLRVDILHKGKWFVHMFTFRSSRNCFWQIYPENLLPKIVYFIRATLYCAIEKCEHEKFQSNGCSEKSLSNYLTFCRLKRATYTLLFAFVII